VLASWLVVCVVFLVGFTGCGSGALTGPSGGESDGSSSTGSNSDDNPTGDGQNGDGQNVDGEGGNAGDGGQGDRKYKWQLPPGDTSPTGNEGSFYGRLRSCKGAVEDLQTENWWGSFNSPRNVLLYMAAAHLCKGDEAGARPFYEEAMSQYGTDGIGSDSRPCSVFRSVSSVLLQAPPESFSCPGGAEPQWRQSEDGRHVDNPLTLEIDESAPSVDPTDEPTDEPTDTPTDEPTEQPTDEATDGDGSG
jgi:hypothetical protein